MWKRSWFRIPMCGMVIALGLSVFKGCGGSGDLPVKAISDAYSASKAAYWISDTCLNIRTSVEGVTGGIDTVLNGTSGTVAVSGSRGDDPLGAETINLTLTFDHYVSGPITLNGVINFDWRLSYASGGDTIIKYTNTGDVGIQVITNLHDEGGLYGDVDDVDDTITDLKLDHVDVSGSTWWDTLGTLTSATTGVQNVYPDMYTNMM
jgi:hypothetical protein